MKLLLSAVIAAACLTAAPAFAGVDGSVGYSQFRDSGVNLSALTGRVGYHFNQYIGAEGEVSLGIDNQTTHEDGLAIDLKLEHEYAAYVVGTFPVNNNLEVFARAGYGTVRGKAADASSSTPVAVSVEESGAQYGVGANWYFAGRSGVRADYTHGQTFGNMWGISYAFRF